MILNTFISSTYRLIAPFYYSTYNYDPYKAIVTLD